MLAVDTGELQRLGILVTSRRVELGQRVRKRFADSVGLSDRLLADIEKGVRLAGAGTYAVLEQELRWQPGSIRDILNGEDPKVVNTPETRRAVDLENLDIDALLAEIRRRVVTNEPQPAWVWQQSRGEGDEGFRRTPSQG